VISESGNRLLACTNNELRILDPKTERQLTSIRLNEHLLSADISANGKFLLVLTSNNAPAELSIYEADSLKHISSFPGFTNSLSCVRLSPRADRLACWSGRSLQLYDVAKRLPIGSEVRFKLTNIVAEFSHDSAQLAVGGGPFLCVFQADTGLLNFWLKQAAVLQTISYTEDDRLLATACADGSFSPYYAQVWETYSWKPVGDRINQKDGVLFAAFNPKGDRLLTGGEDFLALLTAVGGRQPLKTFNHAGQVHYGVFNSDSSSIATLDRNGLAQIWDITSAELLSLRLPLGRRPARLAFIDDFAIATTDTAGISRIWRPLWQKESMAELDFVAKVLNGAFIESLDAPDSAPAKTAEFWTKLQAQYPEDFSVTCEKAIDWHRSQLTAAEEEGDARAVEFHYTLLARWAAMGSGSDPERNTTTRKNSGSKTAFISQHSEPAAAPGLSASDNK